LNYSYQLDKLPHAYSILPISGEIRAIPEDFIVNEELGFSPIGEGEHVFLRIRKKERNTEDVACLLARHSGMPRKSVSYAGLKDRNAVTSQFFSVHLPGKQGPDWQELADPSLEFLSINRHQKKLKRGALSRNIFCLRIRGFSGNRDIAEQRMQQIKRQGVPNYFTSQRFGHNANNLVYAEQILLNNKRVKDRFKRNIYFSAARSWLFNLVLAERVRRENWNSAIAAEIESAILSDWQGWTEGLEKARMKMARRPMRVSVADLSWDWPEENQLELRFSLPPGSYATAVLRELGLKS
jgi:tRNA pseudouridine13 synthase